MRNKMIVAAHGNTLKLPGLLYIVFTYYRLGRYSHSYFPGKPPIVIRIDELE